MDVVSRLEFGQEGLGQLPELGVEERGVVWEKSKAIGVTHPSALFNRIWMRVPKDMITEKGRQNEFNAETRHHWVVEIRLVECLE